jgi:NADP-dependent 3-hydroxy acid dehydrogenase YdfG
MPGAVLTNFGRNLDPEVVAGFVAMTGVEVDIVAGQHLPDHVLAAGRDALADLFVTPEDIADAVMFAVTMPSRVHVAQVVVRPNRDLELG